MLYTVVWFYQFAVGIICGLVLNLTVKHALDSTANLGYCTKRQCVSRSWAYLPSMLWTNPWSMPLTVTCTRKYPGAGAGSTSIYRYSIHASCWGRWSDDTSKVNAVRIQPISEHFAGSSNIKTFPNWV